MPSSSVSTIYGGNWMTVTNVSLSQANQILGASYRLYRNTKTNETIIRTIGYSLPTVLHTHIQTVTPTTCFPTMQVTLQSPHRRPFGPAPAPAPAASGNLRTRIQPPLPPPIIVPAIVRTMYGTTEYEPAAVNGPHRNTLAVVGDRYPSWGDLTEFMLTYQAQSEDASFILARLNPDLPDADPTSSVTVQYTSAMIYPTILFYFGTKKDEVSLTRFLSHVLDRLAPIPTLSISYNYFTEPVVPSQLADTLCHQFARLGARGTSVLVGSGDHGVGDGTCRDGEGNIKFIAEFPSSCTSSALLLLSSTTQGGVQVAHQPIFHRSLGNQRWRNSIPRRGGCGGPFRGWLFNAPSAPLLPGPRSARLLLGAPRLKLRLLQVCSVLSP